LVKVAGAQTFTANGVLFTMVPVEGGTFTMGASNDDSEAIDRERPAHQVTLSSFSIGQTEVTQALWQAVMGSNPSRFTGDLQRPVDNVSWDDCQESITKLNQLTGKTFRLPTEAEWEYAACSDVQNQIFHIAGTDYVCYEWCSDWLDDYSDRNGVVTDPTGPRDGEQHVVRSFNCDRGKFDRSSDVDEDDAYVGLVRLVIKAKDFK
jgi:formylglycine-generating enzyme required for sulfatase activity